MNERKEGLAAHNRHSINVTFIIIATIIKEYFATSEILQVQRQDCDGKEIRKSR